MVEHKGRVGAAVVVVKSRLLDVASSLGVTAEENMLMVCETVAFLQDAGLEVLVDLEHAMDAACGRMQFGERADEGDVKRSAAYMHKLVAQCVEQGVSRIVVCDTTGGASPEEVAGVVGALVRDLSLIHI